MTVFAGARRRQVEAKRLEHERNHPKPPEPEIEPPPKPKPVFKPRNRAGPDI